MTTDSQHRLDAQLLLTSLPRDQIARLLKKPLQYVEECGVGTLLKDLQDYLTNSDAAQKEREKPYTGVSHPACRREHFVQVCDDDNKALQDLMGSEDVMEMVTCGRYPTFYQDPSYPELLVIWDHGEGPHCPYTFDDARLENRGWLNLNVYPKDLWDFVAMVAEQEGLTHEYAIFWLRGAEQ